MIDILFEDNHLLIVNKPAGELVQGDNTGDDCLLNKAERYLREKYNKQGNVFLGLPHRLDRPTSGIVILAKTSKALSRLNNMLRDKQINKTYWAITEERPENYEGRLEHYLLKDTKTNKSKAYNFPLKNSKKAKKSILEYKIMFSSKSYTLLELKLITGRHHQIRAQLAKISCHIKGDLKYGAKTTGEDKRIIYLHARKVEFEHPVKHIPMLVEAPLPKDVYWDIFKDSI